MKNLFILSLLLISFWCKKDEIPEIDSINLEGKWNLEIFENSEGTQSERTYIKSISATIR